MKKTIEKIALVAQTVIALIIAVISLLMALGNIPTLQTNDNAGKVVLVIVCVFSGLYLAFAAYNTYAAFSDRNVLRYVMLTADVGKSTEASGRVIKKIAVTDSSLVEGIKVRRLQVRPDEKLGFKMRIDVEVNSDDVNFVLEKYRCLLVDSYLNILGLKFSSIDFRVIKMTTTYSPDVAKADENAKVTTQKEKQSKAEPAVTTEETSEPQEEVRHDQQSAEDNETVATEHSEAEVVNEQPQQTETVDVTEDIVVTVEDAKEADAEQTSEQKKEKEKTEKE